jgi:hypothetical protein
MAGEEEAQRRLFVHQLFALASSAALRHSARCLPVRRRPCRTGRPAWRCARPARPLPARRRPRPAAWRDDHRCVEGAGADQRLDHAPVHHALVDAAAEIEQVRKRPARVTRLEDHRQRRLAGALDRAQTVADGLAVHRAEADAAVVDVRRQEDQAVVDRRPCRRTAPCRCWPFPRTASPRHEGRRVVLLEPAGVVGDQRIGGGVRLVEAVAGELLHGVEDFVGRASPIAFAFGAGDEDLALLGHLLGLLLAHRATQQVGAAQAVTGRDLRRLHHLFLVHHDAVGVGQHRLQAGDADRPRARDRACAR